MELAVGADAQAMKDRGGEVFGGKCFGRRKSGVGVGPTDDASRLDTAGDYP